MGTGGGVTPRDDDGRPRGRGPIVAAAVGGAVALMVAAAVLAGPGGDGGIRAGSPFTTTTTAPATTSTTVAPATTTTTDPSGVPLGWQVVPSGDGTFTVAMPPWWTSALLAGDAAAVAQQLIPADPAAAGEAVAMVEAFQYQEAVFIACDPTLVRTGSVFSVNHVAGVGDVDLGFVVSENERLPDVAGMTFTDEGRIGSPIGEMAWVRIDAHMADMTAERYYVVVGGDLWWLTYWRKPNGEDPDLARKLALSFRPT
jgi:hypothetical protein